MPSLIFCKDFPREWSGMRWFTSVILVSISVVGLILGFTAGLILLPDQPGGIEGVRANMQTIGLLKSNKPGCAVKAKGQ
jgi:hypothetical protein